MESVRRTPAVEAARERTGPDAGALLDALGDVAWSYAPLEGRLLALGAGAAALYGLPVAALLAEPGLWRAAIHPDDRERVAQQMLAALEGGRLEVEYRIVRAGGEVRWLLDRGLRVDDPSGVRVDGLSRDITERRRAEEVHARRHELLQAIVSTVSEGVIVVDERARFDVYNPQVVEITGYPQADAERPGLFTRLFPDREARRGAREALAGAWAGRDLAHREWQIVRADGSTRDVLVSTRILGLGGERRLLLALRDITEQRRAEAGRAAAAQRLRDAERLESLSRMAGGVAHDFNNLLQSILGFADLASRDMSGGAPARAAIDEVLLAGHRAAELTRKILAYSGRARRESERVDLAALVSACRAELAARAPRGCRLELHAGEPLPVGDADPAQLRQVLLSLADNAFEALAEQGGRVRVSTGRTACDRERLARCCPDADLPEGTYAFVTVVDDGCGMPEEIRQRLFDPFFSTKFTGRGLGLAAVLGIVRSHRGAIEVESRVGHGTQVRVLLPLVD